MIKSMTTTIKVSHTPSHNKIHDTHVSESSTWTMFMGHNPTWYIIPKCKRLIYQSVYYSRVVSIPSPDSTYTGGSIICTLLSPHHLVGERLQSLQSLVLRLSWHGHLLPYSPPRSRFIRYEKQQKLEEDTTPDTQPSVVPSRLTHTFYLSRSGRNHPRHIEQDESVDDEHEPACVRQFNILIGSGGECDVILLETRCEGEGGLPVGHGTVGKEMYSYLRHNVKESVQRGRWVRHRGLVGDHTRNPGSNLHPHPPVW